MSHRTCKDGRSRKLRIEPLEDRRLLAGVTVGNNLDVVNGVTTSIAALISNDGGDGISLREAIQAANDTSGADVITFAPMLSGQTILLGGTALRITDALTIDAAPLAQNVTIDAKLQSRVINIIATGGDFTLAGLTLTRGKTISNSVGGGALSSISAGMLTLRESAVSASSTAGPSAYGGGVYSLGALTLIESTVSGNSTSGLDSIGGGIFSIGALTLSQSTVSGNGTTGIDAPGGGIYAAGAVTMILSAVSGNSTSGSGGFGGGIVSPGPVTLTQSTVSGNSTTGSGGYGGGIVSPGSVSLLQSTVSGNCTLAPSASGGGIYSQGTLTLNRSTVSGNTSLGDFSDGGGIYAVGAVTINQSTVTDNHAPGAGSLGGGVFQFDGSANYQLSINNSIVAGNEASSGSPDLQPDPGSSLAVNYSLIGTAVMPTTGGNNFETDNPRLGPLANNGGPTRTHALRPGNRALNGGDPMIAFNATEFDQRGTPYARVIGGRIDIGAYEQGPLVVDTTSDVVDDVYGPGQFSLREAIFLANDSPNADVITFAPSMSGRMITLNGTQLEVSAELTIDAAPLAQNVTINAARTSRVLRIDDLTTSTESFPVVLAGLNFVNGESIGASPGGAIRSTTFGLVTFVDCTIADSRTTNADGGGIWARNLRLERTTVIGNAARGAGAAGGGIWTTTLDADESTISGNSTTGSSGAGGGVYASGAVTLNLSTVSNNTTEGDLGPGGGIFSLGSVALTHSTVSGNRTHASTASGGGVYAVGAVTLNQSTFSNNRAGLHGGGIFSENAVTLTQSTVNGNSTAANTGGFGGGIVSAGAVTLMQSTISGNSAVVEGGGVYTVGAVTLNQSTVTANFATGAGSSGGGVFQVDNPANPLFSISGSILAGNMAPTGPDLVRDPGSVFTVNYSLIGAAVVPTAGGNNVVTDDPLVDPLASNGGPTPTHALQPDSPALNAGNPTIAFDNAEFDQRGMPFARVFSGRIDIGSFEFQAFRVDSSADVVDSNYGPGQIALREAILLANARPGADTIVFAAGMSGQTITLNGTQLDVADGLTIDATPLAQNVTIDANRSSRVLRIDDPTTATESFAVTLAGLNFVNGRTTGAAPGGAIRSLTSGQVTLIESTIADSFTTATDADGGGIWAPNLWLERSTVSGNKTQGVTAEGGGVWATTLVVELSTISGNSTLVDGGGAYVEQALIINQSTITGNAAGNRGAGVFRPNSAASFDLEISGSILAGNTSPSAPDLRPGTSSVTINHSLLGDPSGSNVSAATGVGNLRNVSAQLGPLAQHGGRTATHALLPGSPALDAGNPAIGFDASEFDQRGVGFVRVANGDNVAGARIDIGAYESRGLPGWPVGDYNQSGIADTADYTVWRDSLGRIGVGLPANGDNSGASANKIDQADYLVWRNNFGNTVVPVSSASVSATIPVAIPTSATTVTSATNPARREELPPLTRGAHEALLLAARQTAFAELGEDEVPTVNRSNSRASTLRAERFTTKLAGSFNR